MKEFTSHALLQDLKRSLPADLSNSQTIERSLLLAFRAHHGQRRESSGSGAAIPYIVHPVGVAKLAAKHWVDHELQDSLETIVAAALMHDVLEDTPTTYAEVQSTSSARCAELILAMTKPPVAKTSDRNQRNIEFIEQIRRAGPAAVYLKICDCLHNLSRPASMPISLMRKTLEKAKGPYRELLRSTPFEGRLMPELSRLIEACERHEAGGGADHAPVAPRQLHTYLETIAARAAGKQFEAHDIVQVLSELPGVQKISSGALYEAIASCLTSFGVVLSRLEIEGAATQIEIDGSFEFAAQTEQRAANGVKLICRGCRLPFTEQPWVCIAVDPAASPEWLNGAALKSIVGTLTERVLDQRMRDLRTIDPRLQKEMIADPEAFVHVELSQHDSALFVNLLNQADFLFPIVNAALAELCRGSRQHDQIDRIEGRVKTLMSIRRKMQERGIGLDRLDDLLGFRVVVLGIHARDSFAEELQAAIQGRVASKFAYLMIDADSVESELVASETGYVGRHVRAMLRPLAGNASPIQCEFQIRTIYEDAWARMSHILAYKRRTLSYRKSQSLLSELAQLRQEADRRILEAQQTQQPGNRGTERQ
jgi:ppGpp synthetase/RelA/SpoT-type nucleotidyltranferase